MKNRLKKYIREDLKITDPRWNDWYLLRFCRARKFKWEDIKQMVDNYLKW